MWYVGVSCGGAYLTIAHALLRKHCYLWLRAIISLVVFHVVGAGAYGHKMHDIHACAFAVETNFSSPLSRLDFYFGGSCEDIVRLSI